MYVKVKKIMTREVRLKMFQKLKVPGLVILGCWSLKSSPKTAQTLL